MIYIVGEINFESFVEFDKALSKYENDKYSPSLHIQLMSAGGDAQVALAFYDRIKKHGNCTITATGYVASAAVLILAAGKHRIMTPNSWVMVHEESMEGLSGDVKTIEREARQLRIYENQWTRLLASVTRATAEQWTELHKAETYLTAEQCLAYGLIEDIL